MKEKPPGRHFRLKAIETEEEGILLKPPKGVCAFVNSILSQYQYFFYSVTKVNVLQPLVFCHVMLVTVLLWHINQ